MRIRRETSRKGVEVRFLTLPYPPGEGLRMRRKLLRKGVEVRFLTSLSARRRIEDEAGTLSESWGEFLASFSARRRIEDEAEKLPSPSAIPYPNFEA